MDDDDILDSSVLDPSLVRACSCLSDTRTTDSLAPRVTDTHEKLETMEPPDWKLSLLVSR